MTANWVLCAAAMVVASLAVVYGSEEMGGGEIAALQVCIYLIHSQNQ